MRQNELSEAIKRDILLAWEGLISARLEDGCYDNEFNPYRQKSRIATAEGLESFLIPCLASPELKDEFLKRLYEKKRSKDNLLKLFSDDIKYLINSCIVKQESKKAISKDAAVQKGFFGDPYWPPESVKKAVTQAAKERDDSIAKGLIETTDCVSFVVPTMLHFWHLFKNEPLFNKINFDDVEQIILEGTHKLVEWHIKNEGWGWGDAGRYNLPTNLYSTWTTCECLGELDDIILTPEIRTGENNQLGIDSKSLWEVIKETKDYLLETYLDRIMQDAPIKATQTDQGPVNLYNDLYALDALLLTYADRKWENGTPYLTYEDTKNGKRKVEERPIDDLIQSKMEISLYKIIKHYGKEEVKKELQSKEYQFYIECGNVLNEQAFKKNPEWFVYEDKGFTSLLLRVSTLFLSYRLGNPIVLEELARELYKDILLTRNTKDPKRRHCWDEVYFGVYKTERAIEALTDIYAFYIDKEHTMRDEATWPSGPFKEIAPFIHTLAFASRLAQILKAEGLPADLLEDDSLLKKVRGQLVGADYPETAEGELGPEVDRRMIELNIEFAHVKKYLSEPTVRILEAEVGEEILRVRNEIDRLGETGYCLCVMLDDYNNRTEVTEQKIVEDLGTLGVRPDYVMRESKLVGIAKKLLASIGERIKSRMGEEQEIISFLRTEGKDIDLKVEAAGKIKYECALLAACWYLVRLGVEPFASEGAKSINKFGEKRLFADRLRNFLDRERYGEAEEATRNIIRQLPDGISLAKRVETLLVG